MGIFADRLKEGFPQIEESSRAGIVRPELDDEVLEEASREDQIALVRGWFLERFHLLLPPADESGDAQGAFQWDAPRDPLDVISGRFGAVLDHEVLNEVATQLWQYSGGAGWVPIDDASLDYDLALQLQVESAGDPCRILSERLAQIEGMLALRGSGSSLQLSIQLAHAAAITALETYLWDTVSFWSEADPATQRRLVETNLEFQKSNLPLSTIFSRYEGLKDELRKYLQDLVWHRLDKVAPILASGLGVEVPPIAQLMKEVVIRHDVVHRGGRTKQGAPVLLTSNDVQRAVKAVRQFVDDMERALYSRYSKSHWRDLDAEEIPF